MSSIRIRLTSEDETESHDLDLDFNSEEVELLSKYVSQCDRLSKAKIFENEFPRIKNFKWTNTEGMKFEIPSIEYAKVCELLHLARPIFLSSEPASFEKTQAIFGKRSKGNALARNLKFQRETYEHGEYKSYFQITVGNIPLFHDATIKTWLNGVEYHQDQDKFATVNALEKSLSTDTMRGIFVSQLSGRIRAIFMLADLAKLVACGDDNIF